MLNIFKSERTCGARELPLFYSKMALFDDDDVACFRTAMKYIKKTMDDIEKRPEDSQELTTILEEVLVRGLSYKETVAMMIDFLMAGIDTVNIFHIGSVDRHLTVDICILNW